MLELRVIIEQDRLAAVVSSRRRRRSMREVVDASLGVPARRVLTAAFLGFAALAIGLSALGLFGVVAHDASARRREIALRVALGAEAGHILRSIVSQGVRMVGWAWPSEDSSRCGQEARWVQPVSAQRSTESALPRRCCS